MSYKISTEATVVENNYGIRSIFYLKQYYFGSLWLLWTQGVQAPQTLSLFQDFYCPRHPNHVMLFHNTCKLFCLKRTKTIFYIAAPSTKQNRTTIITKTPVSEKINHTVLPKQGVQISSHTWEIISTLSGDNFLDDNSETGKELHY